MFVLNIFTIYRNLSYFPCDTIILSGYLNTDMKHKLRFVCQQADLFIYTEEFYFGYYKSIVRSYTANNAFTPFQIFVLGCFLLSI